MASLKDNAGAKRSMRLASRLSPLQRAYLMGFRRARILARRDVNAFSFQVEAVNDEVHAELRVVRRELARLRAIDDAPEAERSQAAVTSGIGVTMQQRFIRRVLNPPGRVARAIWIYFKVVSQLEALPDHDFRHMPISKRDAPAIAWDDAMRSLAKDDVSWSFVGLAWSILLPTLIGGAVAVLYWRAR